MVTDVPDVVTVLNAGKMIVDGMKLATLMVWEEIGEVKLEDNHVLNWRD
jgi:ribosomal protein L13